MPPTLDVIIPCYNAADTLPRALHSAMAMSCVQTVWLVDDASTDNTRAVIGQLARQYPQRVQSLLLPCNLGAAGARNQALLHSQADVVAFLDADDAYAGDGLQAAHMAFERIAHLGAVRLALHPVGFPAKHVTHPEFGKAWRKLEMTVAGNIVVWRALILACGGFPRDALFRRLGGEDVALGNALLQITTVGTLFDQPGVQHHYRPGMHAERLLAGHLQGKQDVRVTDAALTEAEAVTQRMVQRVSVLRGTLLPQPACGMLPLLVERGDD